MLRARRLLLPLGHVGRQNLSGRLGRRHGRKLLEQRVGTLLGLRRYHRQRTKCPLRLG